MRIDFKVKKQAKSVLMNHYGLCIWLELIDRAIGWIVFGYYFYNVRTEIMLYGKKALLQSDVLLFLYISMLIGYLIVRPLQVGVIDCLMHLEDNDWSKRIAKAFDWKHYWRNVKTMFMKEFLIALYSLLFVVPGAVKNYQLYFVPFILNEYEDLTTKEVLNRSKEFTTDYKLDLFMFDISFIGWLLCGYLTHGVGDILYVSPYYNLSVVELFRRFVDSYQGKKEESFV